MKNDKVRPFLEIGSGKSKELPTPPLLPLAPRSRYNIGLNLAGEEYT